MGLTFKNTIKQVYQKRQIVLHHTAGGPDASSAVSWWNTRLGGKGTVATAFVISRDGTLLQAFDPKYWANHIAAPGRRFLDHHSIGIELCNYGPVIPIKGKFYAFVNLKKEVKDVIHYPEGYKGDIVMGKYQKFEYFERYSAEQIKTLKTLVRQLSDEFGIPYAFDLTCKINSKALTGTPGIFTHSSYRIDKSDLHPQLVLGDVADGTL